MLKIHSTRDGRTPAIERMPQSGTEYKLGQAMIFLDGILVPVSTSDGGLGTDKGAHYVCMANGVAEFEETIPVVSANEDIIWELPLASKAEGLMIGGTYALAADGVSLGAQSDTGCFTVLSYDGLEAGSLVRGTLV